MTLRLLSYIQAAAFRTEATILKRYPMGGKALAILMRDGFVEYYDNACSAVRVTMKGRAELRRLRAAAERRAA